MTRIGLALLWLIRLLPLPAIAVIGALLGWLLYVLGRERRVVTHVNLERCFPELSERERARLARAHFRAFGVSFVERGVLWWSRPERIGRMVRVEGSEHWRALAGSPVILLAPHFVGLDAGWTRLTLDHALVSMYGSQKNERFNRALLAGRLRFGTSRLYSRQEGIRPVLRAMKAGMPFYYLPDLDYGPRDAVFAPFMGVPAATITGLARVARLAGARVVPCVTARRGHGYVVRFYPAWEAFPAGDDIADAARMNRFIEERVREMPEQYFWVHKRFKTQPAGTAPSYGAHQR